MKRSTRLAIIVIVSTGILVFGLVQLRFIQGSMLWQRAEGALIDLRYDLREKRPADTNFVFVGVTESTVNLDMLSPEEIEASETLKAMAGGFPWDRKVYAGALERLIGAGAKVVVFDFLFQNPRSEEGDKAFADAIEKYQDKVVIAETFDPFIEGENRQKRVPPSKKIVRELQEVSGTARVHPDGDDVVRRGRYLTSEMRESGEQRKFADQYPDHLYSLSAITVKKFAGKVETPPYDYDNFIDFQGGPGTYVPLSFEMMFVDKLWTNPPINGLTQFLGKIVVIGPLANTFQDQHNTPFGQMAGPELQVQMMSALRNRSWLTETSFTYDRVLTLMMVALAAVICLLASNAVTKSLLMVGTVGGFFVVCQYAFNRGALVVTMLPPLVGFITTGLTGLVFQFFQEQIERRRTRSMLDRYVSKNVAKTILENRSSFEELQKGQTRSIAVLFSDIRGFTSMTEGGKPEQVVQQLNEYFQEMVTILYEKEEGTLQKFIGDAIMAAWGDVASMGAKEDARRAVSTALQMRTALEVLNVGWKTQADRAPLEIGIGVNFGEAIVGEIGTLARTEFTILGDAVNLAARLESATKQFHVDILVGEKVEELTRQYFIFRKIGLLTVKGKALPVEAFSVLGDRSYEPPAWLARYHEGIEMFRARQFAEAKAVFKETLEMTGGQDFLCEMYVEWSSRYAKSPPPADWKGGFVLKDK